MYNSGWCKKFLMAAVCLFGLAGPIFALDVYMGNVTDEVDVYLEKGQVNKDWDEHVIKGFQAYAKSDFTNARLNLQKAYDKGCRDGFVLFRLMVCYAAQDNCRSALKYGQEAVTNYREQYPQKFKESSLFQMLGDCSSGEQAIEYYQQGQLLKPDDVSIQLNLAHKLVELKRYAEAEKAFLDVIRAGKISSFGEGVAYNGLGKMAKARGEHQKAIDYYQKAYEARGSGSDLWGIASAYEGLKDYKRASEYWRKAADRFGHDNEWGQQALKRVQELKGYH